MIADLACHSVYALAIFVPAASSLAILFPSRPLIGVPQHWGLQLWWLGLLGAALALWLGSWTAFAGCAFSATYWSWRIFARKRKPRPKANPLMRLASANLAHFSLRHDDAMRVLAKCGADVIALIESTPVSRETFAQLAATHPYAADTCDLTDKYGIIIRARWPIEVLSRSGGLDAAPRHLSVRLRLPQGALDLIVIHLTNPIGRGIAHRIPGEIADVIAQIGRGAEDLVLCGDCNAAGWSNWLRRLESATGLANRGRLHLTWPTWLPAPLRLPIDHVWARGRAVVLETRLGPRTGSDHLPLLAEIGWRGE